jgi:hypothetical protein
MTRRRVKLAVIPAPRLSSVEDGVDLAAPVDEVTGPSRTRPGHEDRV